MRVDLVAWFARRKARRAPARSPRAAEAEPGNQVMIAATGGPRRPYETEVDEARTQGMTSVIWRRLKPLQAPEEPGEVKNHWIDVEAEGKSWRDTWTVWPPWR